jgi:hypothetical protein
MPIIDLAQYAANTEVTEINYVEVVTNIFDTLSSQGLYSYHELLPLLFNLRGQPLTLKNHFQMRPIFARCLPENVTYKTGRQISKSLTNAAHSVFMSAALPYYNILHVTPLFEMIRKFSSNYVGPLIDESPLRGLFTTPRSNKSVLQRSLRNGSNLFFTFAFNDCTRVRGNTANALKYDEYQNFDRSFEAIINQTVAAANAGLDLSDEKAVSEANVPSIMRFGTPLTLENGLEQSWLESSQGEWSIKCRQCGLINIPSLEYHLEAMLGPKTRKDIISVTNPGLVCSRCARPLYTREGRWWHKYHERRATHLGYHIPQCIMPFHCEDPSNWTKLQQSRFNRNRMSEAEFYNEVCGESYDHGSKLISVTDLKNAAILPSKHDTQAHIANCFSGRYRDWGIGCDWGGGGISGISKTAFAFGGLTLDGIVEIFSGWRSQTPNDFNLEAHRTTQLMATYGARFLAMDFLGNGRLRRDKLIDHGMPIQQIIPIDYARIGKGAMVRTVPYNAKQQIPEHLQVNKTRSLATLAELIKSGRVRLFEYDYKNTEDPGLLHDFTSLAEDRTDHRQVGTIYTIIHVSQIGPDDFADAVNYLVCALFHRAGWWPDVGSIIFRYDLTDDQQAVIAPDLYDKDLDWLHE